MLGGTAVAAGVGTHADAKQDTKLVKALAPTLSVKHAKTATLLGNKNAASLETAAYTYQLPALTDVSSTTINFPVLPGGIYYASYDLVSKMSSAGQEAGCYFWDNVTRTAYGLSYGAQYVTNAYVSTSGAAIVDTRAHAIQCDCFASTATFTVNYDGNSSPDMIFVRVDKVSSGSATIAPQKRQLARSGALGG